MKRYKLLGKEDFLAQWKKFFTAVEATQHLR